MASRLQIPSLQELELIHDNAVEGNYKLKFKSLITFFREHSIHSEKDLSRIENIRRTFQKQLKGHFVENGEEFISLTSCLRFIFLHCDKIDICQTITHEIEDALIQNGSNTTSTDNSILDIYKTVSKLDLTPEKFNADIPIKHFSDGDIPTLHNEHKILFPDNKEWERIKVFEWHFHKLDSSHASLAISEGISRREKFLRECENLLALQPVFHKACKVVIKENSARKAAADFQNGVLLTGASTHIPTQVDATISETIHEVFPNLVSKVVCVACQKQSCSSDKGLHVYLETANDEAFLFDDLCVVISSHLNTVHSEHCHQIVWLKEDTLDQYGNPVQRFHLHDDWTLGKLSRKTLASPLFENDECRSEDVCSHCCSAMHHEHPLDWRQLSIVHEWVYHVPLFVQIIFGSFINPDSLRRACSPSEYLTNKIQRLYSTFDVLLNIINRCYCGIYQELSSDELSLSYHSVNTVFAITSRGGITCSFPEAERRLKRQADPTVLYYKAYLEKYPLEYATAAGTILKRVSLRDCFLVLCIDNLVRLTFHKDANRGDARSSQICTLPITIMGIPKDSAIVQTWHDNDICDGSESCPCKKPVTLTPNDFDRVFIDPTTEEKAKMDFFQLSITWGLKDLWRAFEDYPEVLSALGNATETPGMATFEDLNQAAENFEMGEEHLDLNQSMQSLELGDMDMSFLDDTLSSIEEESEGEISDLEDEPRDITDDEQLTHLMSSDEESYDKDSIPDLSIDDGIQGVAVTDHHDDCGVLTEDMSTVASRATIDASLPDILPDMVSSLGFKVFKPPPLLCRHPPPMVGRDDDPRVLKEILCDIMLKTNNLDNSNEGNHARILFGPDNKIGKNLFKIMASDEFFHNYLPEFPLLHLRKSKIRNLCSAYDDAGLYYLLGFMQDRELDMKHLASMENIEDATRNIRRISFALHLAFIIKFLEVLSQEEAYVARQLLSAEQEDSAGIRMEYHQKYLHFLQAGSNLNGTFALHKEMMYHCDEILAISVAERVGGADGYNLLLAAVKSSLPFSFLNGASSYAAFCCNLLHEHYSAGTFHDAFKKTLFSTPFKGSSVNFGLDTQREMDHREVIKAFRPRATSSSVIPRMSLVDTFASMKKTDKVNHPEENTDGDHAIRTWKVTKKDVSHIVPTALLILRQEALSMKAEQKPRNVYHEKRPFLHDAALDMHTNDVGVYLVKRYAHINGLCGLSREIPRLEIETPKELVTKVKNMTSGSSTVRRMKCRVSTNKGEREKRECKRQKKAKRLSDVANCLTSEMNLCQSVLKPDCTKANVSKASGMKNALVSLIGGCISQDIIDGNVKMSKKKRQQNLEAIIHESGTVNLACTEIPTTLMQTVKVVVMEFAGVKFKSGAGTGVDYIQHIETNLINKTLRDFPKTDKIVICEEKYSFTPDDFKAATRAKRGKTTKKSIVHLKRGSEIISLETFDKHAACSTSEGKSLISTFLAANVNKLHVKRPLALVIDSEWIMEACKCTDQENCTCEGAYAVPIQTEFDGKDMTDKTRLAHVHQKKGEAEMAQIDWLLEILPELKDGESVASLVTSGDIDAVPIHLFALAQQWPRKEDDDFKFPVFVLLSKPRGSFDIYNVTKIIRLLEDKYGQDASMKIATVLTCGGNDFMLKFNGISHDKMLQAFVSDKTFMDNLFNFLGPRPYQSASVNRLIFKDFIKTLYCPTSLMATKLTFAQVRQLSVKRPGQKTISKPQKWMLPHTALESIASLVDLQIEYLFQAGCHSAELPKFLEKGCLQKDEDGYIGYQLGTDIHTSNPEHLIQIPDADMRQVMIAARKPKYVISKKDTGSGGQKRSLNYTPQKGQRRKIRPVTSTPSKDNPQEKE